MSSKLLARFIVDVEGKPRSLFSVRRRSRKEIVLGLSSRYYDDTFSPINPEEASLIAEHKYSVHPSVDSEKAVNCIKQTRITPGKPPQITRHYTKAIKSGEGFAPIYCRRCSHLVVADLIPTTVSGKTFSLGILDPNSCTLVYAVVLGALGKEFIIPDDKELTEIQCVGFDCEYFRVTVLWTFINIQSHHTTISGHILTVDPTNEAEAKMMEGDQPRPILALFIRETMKFMAQLLEILRPELGGDVVNFYRINFRAFRTGINDSPERLEHRNQIARIYLEALNKLNKSRAR